MERFKYESNIGYGINFYFDKSIINITISDDIKKIRENKTIFSKIQLSYKDNYTIYNKYFSDFIDLINKIKAKEIDINLEEKTNFNSTFEKEDKSLEKNKNNKNIKYLILKISTKEEKEEKTLIYKKIYLLNVEYYLTSGPNNKRMNSYAFYSYFKKNEFNLDDIRKFLIKEKIINVYDIDYYRYYNHDKKVFQVITSEIIPIKEKLILEFHYNKILNPFLTNFKWTEKYINDELINIKNQINKYSARIKKYDLIFLYASPIIDENNNELNDSLEYIKEIRSIIQLMKNKRKKFNCFFECAGLDIFSNILIKNRTKILHISSHGSLDNNSNYILYLENLKDSGKIQQIELAKLRNKLELNKNKIKQLDLVIVSTCHSEDFGKLFLEYGAKNVIYIYKKTPIYDKTSMKFSENFYENLIEGKSIKESYDKAIEMLKLDKNIDIPCCCEHFHNEKCELKKYLKLKNLKHYKGCKKSCDCNFTYFNEHNKNCKYYLKLKNDLKQDNIHLIEKSNDINNNIIKICCCDNDIIHDEVLRIIYENNEPKTNQNISPFKYNEYGEVFIDSNISFNYDPEKNFATKGRKQLMGKIFNNIKMNYDNINYTILYGENELLIKEFTESLGVYLYERKIINSYKIYSIKTEFDYIYIETKIVENTDINCRKKNVKIINFDLNEKSFIYMKKIIELFCFNYDYNIYNLYFIFIISTKETKEDQESLVDKYIKKYKIKIDNSKEYKNLFYAELGKYGAKMLLMHLIKNNNYLTEENVESLSRKANNLPLNIKLIAELLLENVSYDKIIEMENLQRTNNKLIELKNDSLYNLYYILLNMPSGLPDSFLQLIFGDYIYINDGKKFIDKYPKNNWNYIKNDKIFYENFKEIKNMDSTYKYLFKILQIYTSLLIYFIGLKNERINYMGGNLYYIYNSYNNKNILKFHNNIDVETILGKKILHKDFSIRSHKKNIINLISIIVDNINLFREICNLNNELENCLEIILLLFPSYFFLKRDCINILKSCINYSDKLIKMKKDKNNQKRYIYLKQKLLLFLYSINETENEILKIENLESDLELEKNILEIMRLKKDKRKKLLELIKDEKIKKELKSNLYYEIAITYFKEEKYEECIQYLNIALNLNNSTDIFKYRIIIDICVVFKKNLIKNIDGNLETKNENIQILDEDRKNFELIMEKIHSLDKILKKPYIKELYYEAYNLRKELYDIIMPDIVMLNSNSLKNNYGYINYCHNNQYYILNQIQNKIKSFIKIKSDILNYNNLNLALERKGEILIIQTDDFSENDDIVCETENGESEIIPLDEILKNFDSINYKVIILCFPKSSKLMDYFNKEINYNYLITFEDFNYSFNDIHIMKTYNKLIVQFVIDFIKYSVQNEKNDIEENILNIFDMAKKNLIKETKKNIKSENYVILSKNPKNEIHNSKILYSKEIKENHIFLYDSFTNLNYNDALITYCDYTKEIYESIEEINKTNNKIINCDKSNKKKWELICYEILKYFHRHKTFCELYYIDINKDGKKLLKSIIRKLNKMWKNEIEESDSNEELEENDDIIQQKMCLIIINNCKWSEMLDINIYSILNCNSSFIIIYDEEINQKKKNININPEKSIKEDIKRKPVLIQYSEGQISVVEDYIILNSLNSDSGDTYNENNIYNGIFNYKLPMIPNGNLFQYVYYGRPFTEELAKLIFYKILKCVNILHQNNYAHLDLELGNIMLDDFNNPVLVISGSIHQADENLKEFDGIINEYTPPEIIIKDNNYDYDAYKFDVYNLGVMLHKLITGEKPTNPPNYNNYNFSDDLKNLLNGMINGNPDERYSLQKIIESNWLDKINKMIKKKSEELDNLEKNVDDEFKRKKDDINKGLEIKENNTISKRANNYNKNEIICEISSDIIDKYNIIKTPNNIDPIDLINHLYNKIDLNKESYINLDRGESYSFTVEIKKENNDDDYNGKRIKIKVELYKIEEDEEYFFRIDNVGYLYGNSDDFYLSFDKIKKELDSILEEEKK